MCHGHRTCLIRHCVYVATVRQESLRDTVIKCPFGCDYLLITGGIGIFSFGVQLHKCNENMKRVHTKRHH